MYLYMFIQMFTEIFIRYVITVNYPYLDIEGISSYGTQNLDVDQ